MSLILCGLSIFSWLQCLMLGGDLSHHCSNCSVPCPMSLVSPCAHLSQCRVVCGRVQGPLVTTAQVLLTGRQRHHLQPPPAAIMSTCSGPQEPVAVPPCPQWAALHYAVNWDISAVRTQTKVRENKSPSPPLMSPS